MSHDLTFVAPERRDEVRRRIDAVERFIAEPGRAMAERCAAELGIKHAQFYNLVRAWRSNGAPEAMMGRNGSRIMPARIDGSVLALIDEVIAEDSRAAAATIIVRVETLSAARAITLPDPTTVSRYVRRKRPAMLSREQRSDLDLIVDHTVVDLPVDFGDGHARRPLCTMIIDVALEAPVGLAISRETPNPPSTPAALLDALRRGIRHSPASRDEPIIGIVRKAAAETENLIEPIERSGFDVRMIGSHAHGGGLVIESLLGREHAGLRLKQRLVWNEGARRSASPPSGAKVMTEMEAAETIRGRLLADRSSSAFAHLSGVDRARLVKDLTSIAQPG